MREVKNETSVVYVILYRPLEEINVAKNFPMCDWHECRFTKIRGFLFIYIFFTSKKNRINCILCSKYDFQREYLSQFFLVIFTHDIYQTSTSSSE